MNLKEIKDIIKLMNENNLAEFELEKDKMRIHIKKQGGTELTQPYVVSQIPHHPAHQPGPQAQPQPQAAEQTETTRNLVAIKSPMVGTFYKAPSPDSPPFIEKGGTVDVGQVVCIIEAMKLMNEIKSEVKGKVVDIVVDNAEPVEFGQPLFLVEPA